MIWFVIGAVLGALQLGLPLALGKKSSPMPLLFVAVGAGLGAAVYGTIFWLILVAWFGI